jgi:hypothetical protein
VRHSSGSPGLLKKITRRVSVWEADSGCKNHTIPTVALDEDWPSVAVALRTHRHTDRAFVCFWLLQHYYFWSESYYVISRYLYCWLIFSSYIMDVIWDLTNLFIKKICVFLYSYYKLEKTLWLWFCDYCRNFKHEILKLISKWTIK